MYCRLLMFRSSIMPRQVPRRPVVPRFQSQTDRYHLRVCGMFFSTTSPKYEPICRILVLSRYFRLRFTHPIPSAVWGAVFALHGRAAAKQRHRYLNADLGRRYAFSRTYPGEVKIYYQKVRQPKLDAIGEKSIPTFQNTAQNWALRAHLLPIINMIPR